MSSKNGKKNFSMIDLNLKPTRSTNWEGSLKILNLIQNKNI